MRIRLANLLFFVFTLSAVFSGQLPWVAAQQTQIVKSELRVLYVGYGPDTLNLNHPSIREDRTSVFEAHLKEYFNDVTVVFAEDYQYEMSDQVDVTIFDAVPPPIGATAEEIEAAKEDYMFPDGCCLPPGFSKPVLMIADVSNFLGARVGAKFEWL